MSARPTEALSDTARTEAMHTLSGWAYEPEGRCLFKQFKFKNFSGAWAFMSQSALKAEKLNHHPDWSNAYNRVEVRLTTHDIGGVTKLDIQLAAAMDGFQNPA